MRTDWILVGLMCAEMFCVSWSRWFCSAVLSWRGFPCAASHFNALPRCSVWFKSESTLAQIFAVCVFFFKALIVAEGSFPVSSVKLVESSSFDIYWVNVTFCLRTCCVSRWALCTLCGRQSWPLANTLDPYDQNFFLISLTKESTDSFHWASSGIFCQRLFLQVCALLWEKGFSLWTFGAPEISFSIFYCARTATVLFVIGVMVVLLPAQLSQTSWCAGTRWKNWLCSIVLIWF